MASKYPFEGLDPGPTFEDSHSVAGELRCDNCRQTLSSIQDVKCFRCLHNFCLRCVPQGSADCPLCRRSGSGLFSATNPLSGFLPQQPSPGLLPASTSISSSSAAYLNASGLSSSQTSSSQPPIQIPSQQPNQLADPLSINTSLLIGNLLDAVSLREDTFLPTTQGLQGNRSSYFGATPTPHQLTTSSSSSNLYGNSPVGTAATGHNHVGSGISNHSRNDYFSLPPAVGANSRDFQGGTSRSIQSPFCQCGEGFPVQAYCQECRDYLCGNCAQAHYRVRMTREHHLTPLHQQQTPATPPNHQHVTTNNRSPNSPPDHQPSHTSSNGICPGHKEPMWLLCETCSRPLCRQCLQDHPGHSFDYLHKANEAELTAQLLNEARQMERSMDEAYEGVKRMNERVEARVLAVSNEIRAVLLHHISVMEERKRDLLQRVDTIRQAKIDSLSRQGEILRTRLTALRTSVDQAEGMLQNNNGGRHMHRESRSVRDILLEQLQLGKPHLAAFETDLIKFSAPDPAILVAIKNLGVIHTGAYAPQSGIVGDSFKRVVTDRTAYFTIQARDSLGDCCSAGGDNVEVRISAPGNATCASDVQDRQNGTYLVSYRPTLDGEHTITVTIRGAAIKGSPFKIQARKGRDYTTIGSRPIFSFGGEGSNDGQLCRPWGIAVNRQGNILIADRSNNRIQVFSKDGQFLYKFGSSGTRPGQFDRPAGIAINSKEKIIVADKDNHRIQVFNSDGSFNSKFGEKGRASGQFNYPWAVAVNSEDQIAISDTRNHRVQLFSENGTFLKKFGFDNSLFYKHFDSPRGVGFLPDGQLIVSDFNNHRLAIINIGSGEMKFYGREGDWDGAYKRPQGLDVDLEGYVIVTDSRNNRIQVLNPEFRSIATFGWDGPDQVSYMDRPCDVCIHPEGRIYVVDFGNNKVHAF